MKNNITLDQDYSISINNDCVTLISEKEGEINPKTGKPSISKDYWHCTSLKNALKRYVDVSLRSQKTIFNVIVKLKEINNKIDNLKL